MGEGNLTLYLIASSELTGGRPLPQVVAAAVAGGVTAVQLREKGGTDRQRYEVGRAVAEICRARGVLFIVNDRLDLALALGADGVHLGQDDLPAAVARDLLGPDRILGVTVETPAEARAAAAAGASYLGTGPIYATTTKADAGLPYGPELVGRIRTAVPGLPVVAVGGIHAGNAGTVWSAGAAGLAVSSAIAAAPDPKAAAAALRRAMSAIHR